MSSTVATVVQLATAYSSQNNDPLLTSNTVEMIAQVNAFERDIYRVAAAENRYFHQQTTLTSTSGSSARTVDLSTPGNVERIILATLADGTVLSQVDVEDVYAALAPRYYVLGQTMHEVSSDWSATTGMVDVTLDYASQPALLDTSGLTSQTVSLPDPYVDLLALKLAQYLAVKDVGRAPEEAAALQSLYDARLAHVMDSLAHYGGTARRRFISPFKIPGGSE